jgi:hypothetical protein
MLHATQVVDVAISESIFNMLEACVPEYATHGHDRPPSGSTISGAGTHASNSTSNLRVLHGLAILCVRFCAGFATPASFFAPSCGLTSFWPSGPVCLWLFGLY